MSQQWLVVVRHKCYGWPLFLSITAESNRWLQIVSTVLTLSELYDTIKILHDPGNISLLDRGKWAFHKRSVEKVIVRLQSNKLSLQLMLTLLSTLQR